MTITAFESRHGIILPAEYRDCLLGRTRAPALTLAALEEWCQPYYEHELPAGFLAEPFPHVSGWNDLSLHDAHMGWDCPYYSMNLMTGSIRFSKVGCEEYAVLVVTGHERGKVWIDARASRNAGIFPVCMMGDRHATFREYLEMDHETTWDRQHLVLSPAMAGGITDL